MSKKSYVVVTHWSCNMGECDSPEDAVEQAKKCQLSIGTGMYEVQAWDEETGAERETVTIFADEDFLGSRRA